MDSKWIGRSSRANDAVADAGGPQALALQQHVENGPFVQAGDLGRALRQILQRLLLGRGAQIGNDGCGADQVGDFHQSTLSCGLLSVRGFPTFSGARRRHVTVRPGSRGRAGK
jgi:hypothetical protein